MKMAIRKDRESLPVAEARKGDGQAWDRLLRRYQLPLYSYVVELVQDEQVALDVVQDTFTNAVRHIRSLRDDARFGSWLFGIAHQKCAQHWRRRSRIAEPLDEREPGLADGGDTPDVALLRQEEEERFMKALRGLNSKHREVLLLHYLEGFSLQDIAEVAAVGVGTVKSRMHTARQALRRALERGT